jgi:hypothetical protein
MEWSLGIVVVIMLGLYVYSVGWTSWELNKKIQPLLDSLFEIKKKTPIFAWRYSE